ncbi:MAG: cobyrinic acid a,c-diamide synthase [Rhodospirillaceae bacterium BRH_c57]|nr:MAG: cobyrinic acid a,c-diamide synthase [Rhodospirillaceae bacterium BRH_c57]
MPAHVITIAQQKGGAGKTTLAAQLAAAFVKAGAKVAVIDIDPQKSLAGWHGVRCAALEGSGESGGGIGLTEVAGWRLSTELERLRAGHDWIIIDSPPHAETDAKAAIRAADLILVPVQPSPMDLWAIGPTLEAARKEKRQAVLVLNRMPPRGNLPDRIVAELAKLDVPVADSRLGSRVAFAASMMEGKGVVETQPRSAAAQEIRALADEVTAMLRKPR